MQEKYNNHTEQKGKRMFAVFEIVNFAAEHPVLPIDEIDDRKCNQ